VPLPIFPTETFNWNTIHRLPRYGLTTKNYPKIKIYEFSLTALIRIFFRAVRTTFHFLLANPRIRRRWHTALPALTSEPFWRTYLSMPPQKIEHSDSQISDYKSQIKKPQTPSTSPTTPTPTLLLLLCSFALFCS
jgi:hypothetical protein